MKKMFYIIFTILLNLCCIGLYYNISYNIGLNYKYLNCFTYGDYIGGMSFCTMILIEALTFINYAAIKIYKGEEFFD